MRISLTPIEKVVSH